MTHRLTMIAISTALLAAVPHAATAQPAPASGPKQLRVEITTKTPTETKVHDLAITDDGCGELTEEGKDRFAQIKICAMTRTSGSHLAIEWNFRDGANHHRGRGGALVTAGVRTDIVRTPGTSLAIKLH